MTKEEILLSTLEYYSENPVERRCIGENELCRYSPISIKKDTSEGCGIGRLLPPPLALQIDNDYTQGVSVSFLINEKLMSYKFPEWMSPENRVFLSALQTLHDDSRMWNLKDNKGLSTRGISYVKRMIDNYAMDESKFIHFLTTEIETI